MNARHYDFHKLGDAARRSGQTQDQIAGYLGLSRPTVARAMSGAGCSYEVLSQIAAHFDLAMTDIVYPTPLATDPVKKFATSV